VSKFLTIMTQIYALIKHPVRVMDLFVPVGWEWTTHFFCKTNMWFNSCYIRLYFPVVCLTTHNVTNIIYCKMFGWIIYNNLK